MKSADDNIAVAKAQVEHDKADLEQKKTDLKRAQELYDGKLISAQDFEAKKVLYDLAVSTLELFCHTRAPSGIAASANGRATFLRAAQSVAAAGDGDAL